MPAMSERIERLFARCRRENRAAFIPYICAGDPNFARTVEIALALERNGADLLELGLPFSDPLADGIVNQLAAQRALEAGATAHGVLDCVREIRRASEIPIVLYTYLNPIFRFGIEKFNQAAADAGVDGLLILDLPPEEDANAQKLDGLKPSSLRNENDNNASKIVRVRLIAPTTPPERIALIAKAARGGARFSCAVARRKTNDDQAIHRFAHRSWLWDLEAGAGGYSGKDCGSGCCRKRDCRFDWKGW
jgi:tryptophan synthase alpha chain